MAIARRIEIAKQLLTELPLTLDRLPYTPDFEAVYAKFLTRAGMALTRHEVWWALLHARKRGLGSSPCKRRRNRPVVPASIPAGS